MWILYGIAFLPALVWFVLWILSKKINFQELGIAVVASLILAVIFHVSIYTSMTSDTEVLSGQIVRATFHPKWIEEYQQMHSTTTTDSKGNSHTTYYYTTEHRTHHEYWDCDTDLRYSKNISKDFFEEIKRNFNNLTTERPYKSGFDGGDRNIYVSYNKTGYVYPVTSTRDFKNLLKCSKTVYSMPEVPANVKVFEYPYPDNWLVSNRLINENRISRYDFDCFNTSLGFRKRINVIMINFGGNSDSGIAEYQRCKFLGGKKNDFVICYSKDGTNNWAKVFSWSESELCKRNIETIILKNPINKNILPVLRNEIVLNYAPKDWSKFDYISIEPSPTSLIVYLIVILVLQISFGVWCFMNEFDKENEGRQSFRNWPFDQYNDYRREWRNKRR